MRGAAACLCLVACLSGCKGHEGKLSDTDPDYRREAIASMTNEGSKSDNPAIAAKLLNDPDPMVRAQAAVKLGKSQDPDAVQFLVQALTDKDAQVRWDTLLALERIGDRSSAPKVAGMLAKEENANTRREAAIYLGKSGDPSSVPALIEAVGDPEFRVSVAAEQALTRLTQQDFGRDKAKWKAWHGDVSPAGGTPPATPAGGQR